MDRLTGDPILGPKLLSFACTWLSAGIILLTAARSNSGRPAALIIAAAALLVFLLFDPLVLYTAGKTWNHEVPSFLLLAAVVFHVEAARRNSPTCIALSGAACGFAVGTRLTFLPCLLALFGLTFLFPREMRRRITMAAWFAAAATVSLLPSLVLFASYPKEFLFGNLEFPRLRLLDPENLRIQKTMSLWRKLRFFFKDVVLPSWPLFLAFVALHFPTLRRRFGVMMPVRSNILTVSCTAGFLVLGCFLPSRYQYQHFFAVVPLLILGIAFICNDLQPPSGRRVLLPGFLAFLAAGTLMLVLIKPPKGASAFPNFSLTTQPRRWFSTEVAAFGAELRTRLPAGPVLTLAPAWPIAGALPVFPEFATGAFAWRSARFVAPKRRAAFHIVGPDDLEAFLEVRPPAGILTGVEEDELEAPLITYALTHGFKPIQLTRKRQLWLH